MVGGVNELSTRLAVPPVASARGEIGIPREPISNTPKHAIPALDLRREPALTEPSLTDGPNGPDRPTVPHVCAAGHAFRGPVQPPARWGRRGRRYFSRRGAREERSARRARQSAALAPGTAEPEARRVWRNGGEDDRREAGDVTLRRGHRAQGGGGSQASGGPQA